MDPPYVHAFVVKLWLERREIADAQPEWRGRIDHVASGKRIYFRDLAEVTRFIQSFFHDPNGMPEHKEDDTRAES